MTVIAPGGHIGILGDGQLGRMMAIAAAEMGYFVHVYGPEEDSPAAQVSHRSTVAPYGDKAALEKFGSAMTARARSRSPAAATLTRSGRK